MISITVVITEEPEVVIPSWMSVQQVEAVKKLFRRNPDGSGSLSHFFGRVFDYGDYCGIGWCAMFIGIEKDGYTHS